MIFSEVLPKENWQEFLKGIKRGDTVFIVGIQRYTQSTREECQVVSKGKKYITIHLNGREVKFYTEFGKQVTDYQAQYAMYPSESTYTALVKEEAEYKDAMKTIREKISLAKLSTLKAVADILTQS